MYDESPSGHDIPVPVFSTRGRAADPIASSLQPLTAALLECVTPPDVFDAVLERGIAMLSASAGLVALVSNEDASLKIVRSTGYPDAVISEWESFPVAADLPVAEAVRTDTAVLLEGEAAWEERYPEMTRLAPGGFYMASASLPLSARGQVFGALHFSFPGEFAFTDLDRNLLGDLARQCSMALDRALLLERAQSAREASAKTQRHMEFLARAGELLGESLDYLSRLESLVRLCVPELVDWAGVDVVGDDGELLRVAVAHRDPDREPVMRELQRRYPPVLENRQSAWTVIHTGRLLYYPEVSAEMIKKSAVDDNHVRLLNEVGVRAALSVPITARGKTLGALSVGMGPAPIGSGRPFGQEVVALVEELGRRAGAAIETARLYGEAQLSKQQAETVLESIGEEFFALDSQWRFTYVNARARQVWRRSSDELIGRTLSEVFPEALDGPIFAAEQAAMRDRKATHFVAVSPVRKRWVEGSVYPAEGGGISVYVRDVHERRSAEEIQKRAADELRASEARYRRLLDTALEGILFLDKNADISRVNYRMAQMLGYESPDELDGRSVFSLFFPEDREAARAKWASRLQGVQEEYELRMMRKDGSELWAIAHVSVERDDSTGEITGTFTMLTDIRERRKALLALQEKSAEVITILESVTDAFFALDENWRFTYVNNEAVRVLLRSRDELVGKSIWDEFPASLGSEFETQYRRAVREQTTVTFQGYYPPPLDSWYDVRAYPAAGGGLSVYFRNINQERREAEERDQLLAEQARLLSERERLVRELESAYFRQQDSLNMSEQRFRLLVEGVRDYAIFLLDTDGRVATWNAGAQRFKGYTAGEIIGRHFSCFYTQEDIDRRHPWAELEIATAEGRYEEEGWRIRKDGTRFWTNVVITALRNDAGELTGFAKVTRDITDRRLREQQNAAAAAMEQQRRFLKDILVSVTQGRLFLCDSEQDLPAPIATGLTGEPVVLTQYALKRLRTLVGEASEASALPQGRTQDLITAASECAMNAVQHAGGGIARVYCSPSEGLVQVWIEDQGKGIDLTHLPRATLEAGFSTGGVGIGHGFSLMIACCQRVHLLTGTAGTTVVLEQSRQPVAPTWLESYGG